MQSVHSLSLQQVSDNQEAIRQQNPISKRSLEEIIYCQPCYKRGITSEPAKFVNLNEFESNRYICENCSFGQTYIIQLNKKFSEGLRQNVKIQNLKTTKIQNHQLNTQDNQLISDSCQALQTQNSQMKSNSISETINVQEKQQGNNLYQEQQAINEFVKNVQINYNDQTKYSIADIGMYTEKITQEYKTAMKTIQTYEQLVKSHILKWKNKLKIQFQGVIGTFTNNLVPEFLEGLKKLQIMQKKLNLIENQLHQMNMENYQEQRQQASLQISKISFQNQHQRVQRQVKSQKKVKKTPDEIYQQIYKQVNSQKQIVEVNASILMMSGTRNLSNLSTLFTCCKGFSQAVEILLDLEHRQTNRRCEFISQKLKLCSIQTLYDAQMINLGLLDNKIERPPIFELGNFVTQKQQKLSSFISNNSIFLQRNILKSKQHQQYRAENTFNSNKDDKIKAKNHERPEHKINQISLLSSQSERQDAQSFQRSQQKYDKISSIRKVFKQDLQSRNNSSSERILLQTRQKKQFMNRNNVVQQEIDEKVKMAKLKSKKPFDNALLNQNKIHRNQARNVILAKNSQFTESSSILQNAGIDLQKPNQQVLNVMDQFIQRGKQLPFPALKEYYSYEKGRNVFQSKIQLNQQNFGDFPPPQLYLASVESLTIKYCPDHTEPWQLLKVLKCFKKLGEITIQEPKLATKDMIIMIAEYFPKLKSLIFKCPNQFDWQLGKLFQKKMTHLINFSVTDGRAS